MNTSSEEAAGGSRRRAFSVFFSFFPLRQRLRSPPYNHNAGRRIYFITDGNNNCNSNNTTKTTRVRAEYKSPEFFTTANAGRVIWRPKGTARTSNPPDDTRFTPFSYVLYRPRNCTRTDVVSVYINKLFSYFVSSRRDFSFAKINNIRIPLAHGRPSAAGCCGVLRAFYCLTVKFVRRPHYVADGTAIVAPFRI